MSQITIQRLNPAHAEDYRALMLEAYERHPDDFLSHTRSGDFFVKILAKQLNNCSIVV